MKCLFFFLGVDEDLTRSAVRNTGVRGREGRLAEENNADDMISAVKMRTSP